MTSYAQSSRNNFREPLPMIERVSSSGRGWLGRFGDVHGSSSKRSMRFGLQKPFNVVNLIILCWFALLWIGERRVFSRHVDDCSWEDWEDWPVDASPHHLVFVADPQLVDPHTYPGRPWPLSTLGIRYTDLYIRRSFRLLQQHLQPDSVFFLGDLFDGGREWTGGGRGTSSEDRWSKYGDTFWLKEYHRFQRIFYDTQYRAGETRPSQRGKRIVTSLPGNHDLGLGMGIQTSVRSRFRTFFGDGNRVDVVGNHTIVSVDTVSLSAKDQMQRNSGEVSAEEEEKLRKKIWEPTQDFLGSIAASKDYAVRRELFQQNKAVRNTFKMDNSVTELDTNRTDVQDLGKQHAVADLPTILLSHIPLYRAPGTPCGPLREHWPPSVSATGADDQAAASKDERNAIPVQAGYQYQNVLTPEISRDLVETIRNLVHVFSGDDHDYCEVSHKGYTSGRAAGAGIKEITVKSISWAMGVRRPGFVMLSMWNPVDQYGNSSLTDDTESTTTQSHLCLLPDQLGIFIRYAVFFLVSTALLFIRALLVKSSYGAELSLPTHSAEYEKSQREGPLYTAEQTAGFASNSEYSASTLAPRTSQTNGARLSPRPGSGYEYSLPLIDHAQNRVPSPVSEKKGHRDPPAPKKPHTRVGEFRSSLWRVAWVVGLWYAWLLWSG